MSINTRRCRRSDVHGEHHWSERIGLITIGPWTCPGAGPCRSRTWANLAVSPDTWLQCGLVEGHDGLHRFRVEWGEDSAAPVCPGPVSPETTTEGN